MLETIIQGILLGGLYCLFAQGLSIMFGVMRLTNIAHGDFIILAAFCAIALASATGSGPLLTALLLLPLSAALGYALQRGVLNRALSKDPLPALVVTFGLAIIIQNGLQEIFSADPRSLPSDGLNTQSFELLSLTLGTLPVMIFGAALLCTLVLQAIFSYTALGRAFRAVSDDPQIAGLMGMDANRVYALATALAFAVISLAGVFQSLRTTVAPADGPMLLLFAFEAVIIGGMGSFWGTFVGAMVLGVAQQIGFYFDPGWGLWFGHLVFLAVLIVRPQGLFPKTKG